MSYSETILGKKIFDLRYENIQEYFNSEKEETLNLEFKSFVDRGDYRDKEKVIIKSVCALLNSEGGIIVWGAPIETKDENGNTKASGDLTPFDKGLDKDKLINKLSSNIIPMPVGIKANFLDDGKGKSIVVIEVDKSIDRPHQFKNQYYIRLDGQTRVAPHYLIKALINSQDFPLIRGHVRLKRIRIAQGIVFLTFRKVLYNTSHFNNDKNVYIRLMAQPGNIYVNDEFSGPNYEQEFSILSHGRPLSSIFVLRLSHADIQSDISLMFQFGGEKSPAKMSINKYNFRGNLRDGIVTDESLYLVEKRDNELPSDVSNQSDDDKINRILDL